MAVVLAVLLALAPVAADGVPQDPERGCAHPATVRVFRMHRRGSSIPARIQTYCLDEYVATVMASGAWPARLPWASIQVGAIAIRQYAVWMKRHHQPGHSWRGRSFDITDSEQFVRPGVRPSPRLRAAVRSTWDVELRKRSHGHWRYFRTGWRGGGGQDGWHLYEDTVSRLARRGLGWRAIVRYELEPVRISR